MVSCKAVFLFERKYNSYIFLKKQVNETSDMKAKAINSQILNNIDQFIISKKEGWSMGQFSNWSENV